jgi:DNA-directed RNA polymerase specialized sigma24 family protein
VIAADRLAGPTKFAVAERRASRGLVRAAMGTEQLELVLQRLDRIEAALADLLKQRTVKDWYSTAEVADVLGRAEYTVREWCRQGRIHARKKPCGRGKGGEWLISHEEVTRLKNEGLLPFPRPA